MRVNLWWYIPLCLAIAAAGFVIGMVTVAAARRFRERRARKRVTSL